MTGALDVAFAPNEGAMLRILGLIERRGYRIQSLTMRSDDIAASLSVGFEARDAGRKPDVLARQIANLHDVSSVDLNPGKPS